MFPIEVSLFLNFWCFLIVVVIAVFGTVPFIPLFFGIMGSLLALSRSMSSLENISFQSYDGWFI